jgi:hypothetical protein
MKLLVVMEILKTLKSLKGHSAKRGELNNLLGQALKKCAVNI